MVHPVEQFGNLMLGTRPVKTRYIIEIIIGMRAKYKNYGFLKFEDSSLKIFFSSSCFLNSSEFSSKTVSSSLAIDSPGFKDAFYTYLSNSMCLDSVTLSTKS